MPQEGASSAELMTAARMHQRGGPEVIVVEQAPRPRPAAGEVLIRVHAASITRGELEWDATWHDRQGRPRLPSIPSHEVSGVVEEVTQGVEFPKPGDAVYALIDFNRDGAAAQYVAVDAGAIALKPRSFDHQQAAAMPLSALTAWQGLFDHARITGGMRVLILGGAGAVGSFAVQIARWAGAKVAATASAENTGYVRDLGAGTVIDHAAQRFEGAVRDIDIVFDTAGGEMLARSPAVLREGGVLVTVAEKPPPGPAAEHSVRPVFFIVAPNSVELAKLAELADGGHLRPTVAEIYTLDETRKAYERLAKGRIRGKIVIKVAG
jgi:NADPH:quinone reductase-like Zn-dependent oxidoreductase